MLWRRAHRQQEELRTRASRQEALATLGQQALAGAELDGLLMDGAAIVARELGVTVGVVYVSRSRVMKRLREVVEEHERRELNGDGQVEFS